MGAGRIAVLTEAESFAVTEDLGGRLLRIALPAAPAGTAALRDGALMAAADLIAAPITTMAAADAATGRILDLAARVARFDVSVFINGPTGSGKEVLARTIHARSTRADKPFVAINCAAIPENMLEAILFGHEKGSFTGAQAANVGILRAADGGTLLLDEISEMPLGLQAKLLRVLQERVVTPLGSQKEVAVDIRVIATSNRNMEEEVRLGRFREDLLYRLNVFPLETMALAERPDDIPVLAQALLRRHAVPGAVMPLLAPEACDLLAAHHWPGNVRELENVMQRAIVLCEGGTVTPEHIMLSARASLAALAAQAA
jgi:two-component system response regulator FlrC